MTQDNQETVNLEVLGYSNRYTMTRLGGLYDEITQANVPVSKNCVVLQDANGEPKRVNIKRLYRLAFDGEYCKDTIPDLEGEEWKPIANTKGKYFVSNLGRVKSLYRYNAKILKPFPNGKGYYRVDVCGRSMQVSRLVAIAFVPNDDPLHKTTVDHIDTDKSNNRASNLRWMTLGDNIRAYKQQKKDKETQNDD